MTTTGTNTSATPGTNKTIPVTVTGFSNIGQFTLTMTFDTTRVSFVSKTTNSSLTGMTVTYSPGSGYHQGTLFFSWTGASNVSLPDGSILSNLTFHYITGTGILSWTSSVCQYKSYVGGVLTPLNDMEKYLFYKDGGISYRGAPVTFAPVITIAAPGTVYIPVTVNGFTNIGALTLYLQYDPAIITYQNSFTPNASLGSMSVGDISASGGYRQIVMQWSSNGYSWNAVTLSNGSTICTLKFNYLTSGTSCALSWYDMGPSCEYADTSDVLIDMPTANYYKNGSVSPPTNFIWTGTASSEWYNSSNWNISSVPGNSTDVVIPASAPHWPVFTGDFTLGVQCRSLTLSTVSSQMTITGKLIIP